MNRGRAIAFRMGVREQRRRPLLLVLLLLLPVYFITYSIAITEATKHRIGLPGGIQIVTDMRELHGAIMVAITVGFLNGLIGVFVVQSAFEADRRLVVAGFRPLEVITSRLAVLLTGAAAVTGVSLTVTAFSFTPVSWPAFAAASLLVGITYALLGAAAGALLGRLGATYFVLFLAMLDVGVVQNPMFGDGTPDSWAAGLPSYGATRVLTDAAFATSFHAGAELALALGWIVVAFTVVTMLLRRALRASSV